MGRAAKRADRASPACQTPTRATAPSGDGELQRRIVELEEELVRVKDHRNACRKKAKEKTAQLAALTGGEVLGSMKNNDKARTAESAMFVKLLERYDEGDRATVVMDALRKSGSNGRDLRQDILYTKSFAALRRKLHETRDRVIAAYRGD